jgi:hypothetical protein
MSHRIDHPLQDAGVERTAIQVDNSGNSAHGFLSICPVTLLRGREPWISASRFPDTAGIARLQGTYGARRRNETRWATFSSGSLKFAPTLHDDQALIRQILQKA